MSDRRAGLRHRPCWRSASSRPPDSIPQRDIRPQSLGVAQSVDALKDGKIDAFFWNGGAADGGDPRPGQHSSASRRGSSRPTTSCRSCSKTYGRVALLPRLIPKGDLQHECRRAGRRRRQPARGVGDDAGDTRARHHAAALREAERRWPPSIRRPVSCRSNTALTGIADSVPSGRHPLLPRTKVWTPVAADRVRDRAGDVLCFGLAAYALYWVVGIVDPQIYRVSFLLIALVGSRFSRIRLRAAGARRGLATPSTACDRAGDRRAGLADRRLRRLRPARGDAHHDRPGARRDPHRCSCSRRHGERPAGSCR